MNLIRLKKIASISKSGIDFSLTGNPFKRFEQFPIGQIPFVIEEEIKSFVQKSFLRKSDRMVQIAAYLAYILMSSEKIDDRLLIMIGSSRGSTETWEKEYYEFLKEGRVSPSFSPLSTQAHISSAIASILEVEKAFNIDHSLTCSGGLAALVNAYSWLKSGMAKFALVGGSEASNTEFTLAQIHALGIGSKLDDPYPCRPFNSESENSFVLAEGAGLALLENCEKNEVQKGDILLESLGFAQTAPPSLSGINSDGRPLQKAMKMALSQIDNSPELILAHAPGTVKGDFAEYNAIKAIFDEKLPAIYSSKWISGHTYAASGMLNLSFAKNIFSGFIPEPYPYKSYLPYKHPSKISRIMINSTGFGGNAVSVVLRKV